MALIAKAEAEAESKAQCCKALWFFVLSQNGYGTRFFNIVYYKINISIFIL
jgi:hypothetical protein